jgi:hypothetical protein
MEKIEEMKKRDCSVFRIMGDFKESMSWQMAN